jgi:hypothetical protein
VAALALGSVGASVALGALSQNEEQKFLPYNVFGDVTASCPHKQHIAFGGFKTDTKVGFGTPNPLLFPASMSPIGNDTNKWSTVAASPALSGGKLSSIAYCQAGDEPKVVRVRKIVLPSAANDEYRTVSATCPQGRNVIGGGWAARASSPIYGSEGQPRVDIMGLKRTSNRTWEVSVVNAKPTQQAVTAIALCGKAKAPKTVTASENIPALNGTKNVTATCPKGTEVAFGGFQGDYDRLSGRNAFIFSFFRSSKRAITVRGGQNYVATNDKASKLQAFAYCS